MHENVLGRAALIREQIQNVRVVHECLHLGALAARLLHEPVKGVPPKVREQHAVIMKRELWPEKRTITNCVVEPTDARDPSVDIDATAIVPLRQLRDETGEVSHGGFEA